MKEFTELRVWQEGKALTVEIYRATESFPRREMFGLTDQLRRAANSVCANIAEGFERYHTKDKIRFYYNARGSISECKSHLLVAAELNYILTEEAQALIGRFDLAGKLLNAMISSLYRCDESRDK